MKINETIKKMIDSDDIVLFMKGTPDFPQCGFSAHAVGMMDYLGVDYKTYNVLEDDELRQGIKQFSDWPTIPQIYIKQEFIGGIDIMKEMLESGELVQTLNEKNIHSNNHPNTIDVS
ncbi:MAG: monothiol glutaredoxin, Grx4 family [Woeseia sp.]|nr:monothiol glutaredoxin, Grx4 family [Woeseia sp.]|tara:strand:- start:514 stop:864 length:351 start_codon:yes stop_codon:yes gene_type:complete